MPKSAAEISRVNQVKREQDNILEKEGIRGKTITQKFRVKMMRYKWIGISWVYKGRPWFVTSPSDGFSCCLSCAYLGCWDAADPPFLLKSTRILS